MNWVVPDFETVSACDLKKAGADRYAEDPTTEVLTLRWKSMDEVRGGWRPGEPHPPTLLQMIAHGWVFVAHNARFERAIWREHMVKLYGFPDIPLEQWADTMAKSAMLVLPQALDRVLKVLDLPQQKDAEGNRLVKSLSRLNRKGYYPARTPEVLARIDAYCDTDVEGQWALHRRIGWLPPAERRVWELDQIINDRGFGVDMPLVRQMQKIVTEATVPLAAEFQEITGGLKFTQVQKVKEWVQGRGVPISGLSKEVLEVWLGKDDDDNEDDEFGGDADAGGEQSEHVDLPDDVRRVLSIRRLVGSASVKKLLSMEKWVSSDWRARGTLSYHGAGPGRWAGRGPQPQNFPRGSIKGIVEELIAALMTGDKDYVETLFGPAVETVLSSLRNIVVAAEGKAFVAGDFAGIEARICLAAAGQHDKVALMASGADVYIDMALEIWPHLRPLFEGKVSELGYKKACDWFKDAYLEERQTGKNSVLGLGFQMGAEKFFNRYCADRDLAFAQDVVDTYRERWAPKVPDLWYGLQSAALSAVRYNKPQEAYGVVYRCEDRWLTARLPSGRKLWYFNPLKVSRRMPWDFDDIRLAWSYQAMKMGQWKTIDAFGGQLTENVVQGLARDLLVHAMFNAERAGMPIVLTVHDEIVAEVPEDQADPKRLEECMLDLPKWAAMLQVPVAAECWAGRRYKK